MKILLSLALLVFMTPGIHAQDNSTKAQDSTSQTPDSTSQALDNSSKALDNSSKAPDSPSNVPDNSSKALDSPSKMLDNSSKVLDSSSKVLDGSFRTQDHYTKAQEYYSDTQDFSTKAQNNASQLYFLFEFMQVNDEHGPDYLQVEEFWSGIHQQRVADKTILGWDLWSLSPSGTKQGSQYLTITLFATLRSMLQAIDSLDVMGYAKKAYPDKTDEELTALLVKTEPSRDIAYQVFLKEIDKTKDGFKVKIGTLATLDIIKQLDDSYEKVESEIFKPWHQEMVNKGKEGSWALLRTILPAGSEAYGTHIIFSMYNDAAQLAPIMEGPIKDMNYMTQLAVKEGLKTRDNKETKIAKLLKTVR